MTIQQFPNKQPIPAPHCLQDAGRAEWETFQKSYYITDQEGLALLRRLCVAVDDEARWRSRIAADGEMITTPSGHPIAHPGFNQINKLVILQKQPLRALNLNPDPERRKVGRPTGFSPAQRI